jgi:hypothetical protein
MIRCPDWRAVEYWRRRCMASLKDGARYRENSGARDIQVLPVVADVVCWVGLLVCAVGFLLLVAEAFAVWFGL